jgi:hypothetical protein
MLENDKHQSRLKIRKELNNNNNEWRQEVCNRVKCSKMTNINSGIKFVRNFYNKTLKEDTAPETAVD